MKTDRRSILDLVALGRIDPAEAERLLIVCNEGREAAGVLAAALAMALFSSLNLQKGLAVLLHLARELQTDATHLTIQSLLALL